MEIRLKPELVLRGSSAAPRGAVLDIGRSDN
jgi:hypothetical protein